MNEANKDTGNTGDSEWNHMGDEPLSEDIHDLMKESIAEADAEYRDEMSKEVGRDEDNEDIWKAHSAEYYEEFPDKIDYMASDLLKLKGADADSEELAAHLRDNKDDLASAVDEYNSLLQQEADKLNSQNKEYTTDRFFEAMNDHVEEKAESETAGQSLWEKMTDDEKKELFKVFPRKREQGESLAEWRARVEQAVGHKIWGSEETSAAETPKAKPVPSQEAPSASRTSETNESNEAKDRKAIISEVTGENYAEKLSDMGISYDQIDSMSDEDLKDLAEYLRNADTYYAEAETAEAEKQRSELIDAITTEEYADALDARGISFDQIDAMSLEDLKDLMEDLTTNSSAETAEVEKQRSELIDAITTEEYADALDARGISFDQIDAMSLEDLKDLMEDLKTNADTEDEPTDSEDQSTDTEDQPAESEEARAAREAREKLNKDAKAAHDSMKGTVRIDVLNQQGPKFMEDILKQCSKNAKEAIEYRKKNKELEEMHKQHVELTHKIWELEENRSLFGRKQRRIELTQLRKQRDDLAKRSTELYKSQDAIRRNPDRQPLTADEVNQVNQYEWVAKTLDSCRTKLEAQRSFDDELPKLKKRLEMIKAGSIDGADGEEQSLSEKIAETEKNLKEWAEKHQNEDLSKRIRGIKVAPAQPTQPAQPTKQAPRPIPVRNAGDNGEAAAA